MTSRTSIVFAGVGRSDPVERAVSDRADALAARFPEVITCRVALEAATPSLSACYARVTIATRDDVFLALETPLEESAGGVFAVIDRAFARICARLERHRPRQAPAADDSDDGCDEVVPAA